MVIPLRNLFLLFLLFTSIFAAANDSITSGIVKHANLLLIDSTYHWDGIYGDLTGNIYNATYEVNGNNLTHLDLNVDSIGCANPRIVQATLIAINSNSINLPLHPGNLTQLDQFISTPAADNASATFTSSGDYTLTYGTFTNVPTADLPHSFREGYLQDSSGNFVFVAPLCDSCTNWQGSSSDYEIILPRNDSTKTNYSLWIDVIYECLPVPQMGGSSGSGTYYGSLPGVSSSGSGGLECSEGIVEQGFYYPNCAILLNEPFNSPSAYDHCKSMELKAIPYSWVRRSCGGYTNITLYINNTFNYTLAGLLDNTPNQSNVEFLGNIFKTTESNLEFHYVGLNKPFSFDIAVIPANGSLDVQRCYVDIINASASVDNGLQIVGKLYNPSPKSCEVNLSLNWHTLDYDGIISSGSHKGSIHIAPNSDKTLLFHYPIFNCSPPGMLADVELSLKSPSYSKQARYSLEITHSKNAYMNVFPLNNSIKICLLYYDIPPSYNHIKIKSNGSEVYDDILFVVPQLSYSSKSQPTYSYNVELDSLFPRMTPLSEGDYEVLVENDIATLKSKTHIYGFGGPFIYRYWLIVLLLMLFMIIVRFYLNIGRFV